MALRVRSTRTSLGVGEGDARNVHVNVEVYDDVSNQVLAQDVITVALGGLRGKTDAQKRQLIIDAADVWAARVKADAVEAAPVLTLMGQSKAI